MEDDELTPGQIAFRVTAWLVVLLALVLTCVAGRKGCKEEKEEREREKRERREAMFEEAVERTEALAADRGAVAGVDCKEERTNLTMSWGEYTCSAVLVDGRWMRVTCDIGELPGCRIDWIGREGGPTPKAEEERHE